MLFQLLLLCACATLCNACSCVGVFFPDSLCSAKIVFRGVAISETTVNRGKRAVELQPIISPPNSFDLERVYTVRVDQAFRMPESLRQETTLTISTSNSGALCGYHYNLNVDTLVVAYQTPQGEVRTGLCSGNRLWDSLTAANKELLESQGLEAYCADPARTRGGNSNGPVLRPFVPAVPFVPRLRYRALD